MTGTSGIVLLYISYSLLAIPVPDHPCIPGSVFDEVLNRKAIEVPILRGYDDLPMTLHRLSPSRYRYAYLHTLCKYQPKTIIWAKTITIENTS